MPCSLLPPNVAFSLKASAKMAPKTKATTAATFDSERVQDERYQQQHEKQQQQQQQLPTITRAMQVARIYESFRALPELDVHSAAGSAQRLKRMSDLAADGAPHATANDSKISTAWPPTTTATTTARMDVNMTTATATNMRKRTASADMLSRNISIILENLLKSYEQSQLPTHGQGECCSRFSYMCALLKRLDSNTQRFELSEMISCRHSNGGANQHSHTQHGPCVGTGYGLLYGLLLSTVLA